MEELEQAVRDASEVLVKALDSLSGELVSRYYDSRDDMKRGSQAEMLSRIVEDCTKDVVGDDRCRW